MAAEADMATDTIFVVNLGAKLMAAVSPRNFEKNCFRDGSWLTGQLNVGNRAQKEGRGVSLVNQNFDAGFVCEGKFTARRADRAGSNHVNHDLS